jgi:hypothetical protein
MKVRHFGFLHASCAVPTHTPRRMILQGYPIPFQPTQIVPPKTLRRQMSYLWRPDASCHASVDLRRGVYRYQLRVTALTENARLDTVGNGNATRASSSRRQAAWSCS